LDGEVMPELPEITVIARQMNRELKGKRIAHIEAKQPKNLNMPIPEFLKMAEGKIINNVSSKEMAIHKARTCILHAYTPWNEWGKYFISQQIKNSPKNINST